jgi:RNA-directed DNA polymerase
VKPSTPSANPSGGDEAAGHTHRALNLDEATTQELLQAVLASDNLALAWKRVKANKGAPGIDGMTIEVFPAHARTHWPAVRQQISEGRYQPQAVRRVEIPKPDGGKRLLALIGRYLRAGAEPGHKAS